MIYIQIKIPLNDKYNCEIKNRMIGRLKHTFIFIIAKIIRFFLFSNNHLIIA